MTRGPSEESLAAAHLAHAAAERAHVLVGATDDALEQLWDELWEIPAEDLTLLVELPRLMSPELDRLRAAIAAEEWDAIENALPAVVATVDTPTQRAHLARALVALEGIGRIDRELAAAGLMAGESSELLHASLIQALAVDAGVERAPGGLLVAA